MEAGAFRLSLLKAGALHRPSGRVSSLLPAGSDPARRHVLGKRSHYVYSSHPFVRQTLALHYVLQTKNMTFIFLYRTGKLLLTDEQKMESRQVWDTWNAFLKETYGIRTAVGKVVTSTGVVDYRGDLKGASIVEAGSLAEAVEIAKKSPTVKYGGAVEVLEEFQG